MTLLQRSLIALGSAIVAGVAMSFGQTFSPEWLAPLFNSAAPVVAVAALVSLAGMCAKSSPALGALAGPAVLLGYYATSTLRGFATSTSWVLVWVGGGLVFGSLMGLGTWLLRGHGPMWARGLAAALWPGIAIGEAAHGLARIADTTPVGYWTAQAVIGAGVLAWLALTRVTGLLPRLIAFGATAVTAGVLYWIMGAF